MLILPYRHQNLHNTEGGLTCKFRSRSFDQLYWELWDKCWLKDTSTAGCFKGWMCMLSVMSESPFHVFRSAQCWRPTTSSLTGCLRWTTSYAALYRWPSWSCRQVRRCSARRMVAMQWPPDGSSSHERAAFCYHHFLLLFWFFPCTSVEVETTPQATLLANTFVCSEREVPLHWIGFSAFSSIHWLIG